MRNNSNQHLNREESHDAEKSSDQSDPSNQSEFECLCLLYLDGLANEEQLAKFNTYLHTQPTAAARLTDIAELHAQLRELGRSHTAQPIVTNLPLNKPALNIRPLSRRHASPHRHSPFTPKRLALVAVIAMTVGALALSVFMQSPGHRLVIEGGDVELTRAGNKQTISQTMSLLPGDQLATRVNSRATVTTNDGSRIIITPNSQLTWQRDNVAIHLDAGSVIADITPQPPGNPFLADTSHARITVLGTRFSLTADHQVSILDVDHGSVRLGNRHDQQTVMVESQHSAGTAGTGALTAVARAPARAHETGLTGDYFNHLDFTQWSFRRTDAQIDFDWLIGSPDPRIAIETYAVRWRGYLIPPIDASYTFFVEVDDGARLWIGNHLLIDRWGLTSRAQFSGSMTLNAGQPYSIQLDYFQDPSESLIKLHWSYPDQPQQILPTTYLRPMTWESDKP